MTSNDAAPTTTNQARITTERCRPRAATRASAGRMNNANAADGPSASASSEKIPSRPIESVAPHPPAIGPPSQPAQPRPSDPETESTVGTWTTAASAAPPATTIINRNNPSVVPVRAVPTTRPTKTTVAGTIKTGSTPTNATSAKPVTNTSDQILLRRAPGPGSPPRRP